jgi:alkylmercury lyase-like protein
MGKVGDILAFDCWSRVAPVGILRFVRSPVHIYPRCQRMTETSGKANALAREIRLFVFRQAAETARVPQPPEIAFALGTSQTEVEQALRQLAAGKVLILAPNDGNIWAANPFCAVPSPFRVETRGRTYWGICIWDALGIVAALGADAVIRAVCGDCSEPMALEIAAGKLRRSEGIIHFAVAARHWWDNIGFT